MMGNRSMSRGKKGIAGWAEAMLFRLFRVTSAYDCCSSFFLNELDNTEAIYDSFF